MFLRDVSLLAPLGVSLAFLVWNVLSLNDLGSASYFHRMWQLRRMRLPAPTSPRKHRDTKLVLRHHVSQKKFPKAPAVWECTLEGLTHSRDWWGGEGTLGEDPGTLRGDVAQLLQNVISSNWVTWRPWWGRWLVCF